MSSMPVFTSESLGFIYRRLSGSIDRSASAPSSVLRTCKSNQRRALVGRARVGGGELPVCLSLSGCSVTARVCPLFRHYDSKTAGHPEEIMGIAMRAKSMHTHQVGRHLQLAPQFQESLPSTSATAILASGLRRW